MIVRNPKSSQCVMRMILSKLSLARFLDAVYAEKSYYCVAQRDKKFIKWPRSFWRSWNDRADSPLDVLLIEIIGKM